MAAEQVASADVVWEGGGIRENRMAMSYGGGYGGRVGGCGMGGFGGRGMPMGIGGMNQQQYGPNQQYPNQQYPNQQYPNQMGGYNQQYQNQMGGGMVGPGVACGGTMLLGEGIKRILRHVRFFPFCLTPNDNLLTRPLSMSCISSSSTCQQTRKWLKLYRL